MLCVWFLLVSRGDMADAWGKAPDKQTQVYDHGVVRFLFILALLP